MKIIVQENWLGQFEAIDDSTYDKDEPIGRGITKEEAIEDLIWQLENNSLTPQTNLLC